MYIKSRSAEHRLLGLAIQIIKQSNFSSVSTLYKSGSAWQVYNVKL